MTLDDSTELDSRQTIKGDASAQIAHKSLATSWLWWETVASLVLPILETSGPDAFALILGQRSVVEVNSHGELKRTRLRSVLRGGVSAISVVRTTGDDSLPATYDEIADLGSSWSGDSLGIVGANLGESGARWRFIERYGYLRQTVPKIRPGAIVMADAWMRGPVDTTQDGTGMFEEFEMAFLAPSGVLVVIPHTSATYGWLATYLDWVRSGRPTSTPPFREEPAWDPEAPPDPVNYTHPVPVKASFKVTGLAQDGEWRSASDLEAARALLQSRFDLRIGLWDLASNPVLRSTILDSKQVSFVPEDTAPIPSGAAVRADIDVSRKLDERTRSRKAHAHLEALGFVGWKDGTLPLTKPVQLRPDEGREPLLWLIATVNKRHTSVSIMSSLYNHIDIQGRVRQLQTALEQAALGATIDPDQIRPVIWRVSGGWGDRVDWPERVNTLAELTPKWIDLFQDLASECWAIWRKRRQGLRP